MKNKFEKIFVSKHGVSYRRGTHGLNSDILQSLLKQIPVWELVNEGIAIRRRFEFKDFHQTMLFVKRLASIAIEQDHHPDVSFGYNYCSVLFTTHSINKLSENDFICAAKLDEIFAEIAPISDH